VRPPSRPTSDKQAESPAILPIPEKIMEILFIKFNDIDGNSYTINVSEILAITNKNNVVEVITIYEEAITIDNETYKAIDNSLDNKNLLI
jgi:hypothetical protein